jgi:hypothetical protein
MRLTLDDTALCHLRVHRFAARCAIAVASVTLWSSMPLVVRAQGYPVPQTNVQGPLPTPVGHRQPRAQDLPPDVLRDEGMARHAPEAAPATQPNSGEQGSRSGGPFEGGDLRICREC